MFGKLKSFFGRKSASSATTQPQLATSRLHQPEVATRSRSAAVIGPPSTESVMAAKRHSTATAAASVPSPAATSSRPAVSPPAIAMSRGGGAEDYRRTQKSMKQGERMKAQDFMAVATAQGTRDMRAAKAKEVILKTRHGETDGLMMRHRSGSVTELHLAPDSSKVTAAKHFSKTTGEVSEVRESHMRGAAQKQLSKAAARKDHRGR